MECQLAMKDLAASKAVLSLQILRRNDLRGFHKLSKIWRVRGNGFDNLLAKIPAARVPTSVFQFVRRELHVRRKDMFALGRKRWIEKCRNREIEIRSV